MFKGMAAIAALIASLSATTPVWAQSPTAAPPSIADFLQDASLSQASLSPSGRYLVWVRRTGDNNLIQVFNLDSGDVRNINAGSSREHFGGLYIDWIEWKSDDRLLVGMTGFQVRRRGGREAGEIQTVSYGEAVLAMNRDGSNMVNLRAPGTRASQPGSVLDTLRSEPDHILMTYREGNGSLNVARVNILTGEAAPVLDGHRRVVSYLTDRNGAVVGRIAYRGSTGRVIVMEARSPDGGWTEVFRLRQDEVRDLPDYTFLGATDEPGKIYVTVRPEAAADGTDTAAVHEFDFRTRTLGPSIWRHDRYDVAGIVVDSDSRELLGGCYWVDTYTCDFGDRRNAAIISGIKQFLGEGWSASVESQADDGSRWLIRASAPHNPGGYYVYDAAERRMIPLGVQHPQLPEASLGLMTRVDYTANDGQALFGYLTRPPGTAPEDRPPLIVMPHGGPELRDFQTYDMWVQFLTSRGYQVFQPNFRGSSGMGRAFAEAGYRQWGGVMQDDVTAGVEHLIAQGLADRERICIVGASYGGYAALWGGAAQPDLYRCVVSVAGVSDLVGVMNWERAEAGADSDRYEYWVRSIGDPRADRQQLEAVSPIRRAAQWRPPLLLIHGEKDDIVPVSQSIDMQRALQRAGRNVRLVVLQDEGHSGWSTGNETTVLTEIETFLTTHLPVAQP